MNTDAEQSSRKMQTMFWLTMLGWDSQMIKMGLAWKWTLQALAL